MQVVQKLLAHLQCHFHGKRVSGRHNADMRHVADRHAFQRHRRAVFDACGILEIGAKYQLPREQAAVEPDIR